MTVYIVMSAAGPGLYVHGVFSDKEKAQEYCDNYDDWIDPPYVEEWEVL